MLNLNFHPAPMQYQKLPPKFWADLQKLTAKCILRSWFGSVSIALSIAAATTVATVQITQQPANASTITSWQFDPATNQLEITLPEGTTPTYSLLNPSQIAVDLPNTTIGVDVTQLYPQGNVHSVGVTQLPSGSARILVNLAPGVAFNGEQIKFQRVGENRWVLRPSIEPASYQATLETPAQPAIQVPPNQPLTDSNSTAAIAPVQPASAEVITYEQNSLRQSTPNDQIRPINVPLVRVPVNRPKGVGSAPVRRPAAPEQRIIDFGEPLR
ncbi:AMIN domain-containing protein [Lyngbya sp. CCAP 1446/10]|uniref:AMIN domain-containing protein n=1 Tax=Lyngbya sp. CCAP 1446/10 TaxID=439293 RepID=UPI0022378E5A|nr:AMIN domain-containing protein [Lyngbya sp. CCAP 1446/10]